MWQRWIAMHAYLKRSNTNTQHQRDSVLLLDHRRSILRQSSGSEATVRVLDVVMRMLVGLTRHATTAPKDTAAIFDTVPAVVGRNVILATHVHAVASANHHDVNEQWDSKKGDQGTDDGNHANDHASATLGGIRKTTFASNGVEAQALHDLGHEDGGAATGHPPIASRNITRVKESNLPFSLDGVLVHTSRHHRVVWERDLELFSFFDTAFRNSDYQQRQGTGETCQSDVNENTRDILRSITSILRQNSPIKVFPSAVAWN
jgi:hypothetical protein